MARSISSIDINRVKMFFRFTTIPVTPITKSIKNNNIIKFSWCNKNEKQRRRRSKNPKGEQKREGERGDVA